jgi:biopolymer transport protein ExbD
MERFSRKKRRTTTLPEITLTPLIDTALTLLIIFMVTAPMINNAIKVDLPKGKAQEVADNTQELTVFINKDEKLFLNGTAIDSSQELIDSIKKTIGKNKDRTVCVKADKLVKYGHVIELIDHIKVVGGVSYVVLATQRA